MEFDESWWALGSLSSHVTILAIDLPRAGRRRRRNGSGASGSRHGICCGGRRGRCRRRRVRG